jgi:hypothetical protein
MALGTLLCVSACQDDKMEIPTPRSICEAHFPHVIDAESDTVAGVTDVGPQRAPPAARGRLATYTGDTAVTLCLVPGSNGLDNAVAITPDGATHVVWQQSGADVLVPPV